MNQSNWQRRLDDLKLARQIAIETQLVEALAPIAGNNRILIKCEHYQPIRSFKIRGATYVMASNLENLRRRGVVADSGGNHSQAVALAGRNLEIPVKIIMAATAPEGKTEALVPQNKVDATRSFGASDGSFELDISPTSFTAAKKKAKYAAGIDENGNLPPNPGDFMEYLSPYDHPSLPRGTGTILTEIIEQHTANGWPLPDAIHVPIGGGGLMSGIADVNSELERPLAVIGHALVKADSAARTLAAIRENNASEPVEVPGDVSTVAEGLAVKVIGNELFKRLKSGKIDEIYTVSELADIASAYQWYFANALPALGVNTNDEAAVWDATPEVSSIVPIAGLFKHLKKTGAKNQTHVVIISGANTNRESYDRVMNSLT
jgi:threonine dehydratase